MAPPSITWGKHLDDRSRKTRVIINILLQDSGQCIMSTKNGKIVDTWLEAGHMLQADANRTDCSDGSAAQGADLAEHLHSSHHSRQQAAAGVCSEAHPLAALPGCGGPLPHPPGAPLYAASL